MRQIDLSKSVYELTEQYPELIDILKELGLLGVSNEVTRKTLGRMTTIPQGCEKMGKPLDEVKVVLNQQGFNLIGDEA
jgi:hypothetical protein